MNPLDQWYEQVPAGHQELLLAMRGLLMEAPYHFSERYAWRIPTFYFERRYLCYLYYDAKGHRSYLAFVDGVLMRHPSLLAEGRRRIRILNLNPLEDLPFETISHCLLQAIELRTR